MMDDESKTALKKSRNLQIEADDVILDRITELRSDGELEQSEVLLTEYSKRLPLEQRIEALADEIRDRALSKN